MELLEVIKEFIRRTLENSHMASSDELEAATELAQTLASIDCLC